MFENGAIRWLRRALVLIALVPYTAFAEIPFIVPENCRASAAQTCGLCDIAQLAQNTINAGIYIAVFLAAFLFAWAGWKYVTAGGDSGKAGDAKKIFWTVGVGLVLILAAWLIVDLIMKILVNENAIFGPWNEVC
ncbi:hypothetical protein HY414_00185 [Candidatus Kaiserbacteria bacterium]|nr:hypothetical protein [Candidatus Kaiserbacteria bacterium]